MFVRACTYINVRENVNDTFNYTLFNLIHITVSLVAHSCKRTHTHTHSNVKQVRGGRYFREVIGDVAWTSFQGELDRYTCLQELLCHPSSRIARCRVCVRTPADEIVSNNQALITRSTMSLNDLGHFVQRCLDDRRADEPNYRSRGFAKFLWSSDQDQDDGEYVVFERAAREYLFSHSRTQRTHSCHLHNQ